eukprot:TRINITY_DN8510_c0_g1::TRINITY_DN8510_c0_g1_i1::g.3390::m.3390 TRINITY_DN8510_c0_g1::TRINITY_DN8510_c0_g1_i1::g.3390  ORF type:complete len:219 (+),score=29.61,sp/Q9CQ02/COMD4_MOUSE/43.37/9e-46,HCaRG/PF07258.9/2.6e-30 TRINITY_DN8510_c0_g1_i1:52-657(+)
MKFRFCGELDAPDWVLAEIATLSKLSSVRVKLLCTQIVNRILGLPVDPEKLSKLTNDANLTDESEVRAAVALIHFVLFSSAKYDVEDAVLFNELEQLGLPKEHCQAFCRVFKEKKDTLRSSLREQSLSLPTLDSWKFATNYLLLKTDNEEEVVPSVRCQLQLSTGKSVAFEASGDKLQSLCSELASAYSLMMTVPVDGAAQ